MEGKVKVARVSRSAGVEKANSRDLTQQKGLAWGQPEQGGTGR